MPATSILVYYGVSIPRYLNHQFIPEYNTYFMYLAETLKLYELQVRDWDHESHTNSIIIGKFIGEIPLTKGIHSASHIHTTLRNLDTNTITYEIQKFLKRSSYLPCVVPNLYFVPNWCSCCS